jgi:hypothetical protein
MKRADTRIVDADVATTFASYPPNITAKLLRIRKMIFDVAAETDGVGELEETLRWGEPTYLTTRSKSGSMVRMAWKQALPDRYALYFHCQTNLIATFKGLYPDEFTYEGKRSISFAARAGVPVDPLRHCIALTLTYHLDKRRGAKVARKGAR